MFGREHRGGLDHAEVVPIELQADTSRGRVLDVTVKAIGAAAGQRMAGVDIRSGESSDYTVYLTRRWRQSVDPLKVTNLRPLAVELLYGAGSDMTTELAFNDVSVRGFCYHVCAQSLRLIVKPLATPASPDVDDVIVWVAKGRPSTIRAEETVTMDGATVYTLPAFTRRFRIQRLTAIVAPPGPGACTVAFKDARGVTVQTWLVPASTWPYEATTIVDGRAVSYTVHELVLPSQDAVVQYESDV